MDAAPGGRWPLAAEVLLAEVGSPLRKGSEVACRHALMIARGCQFMKIGVSLRSGYVPMAARAGAQWMTERARAAAAAGLDSLFIGDHHNVPVPYYQNVPMLGRLLAEWDARPAGALFLLPLWHPVLLAEQVGTLASIAQGPFILQCAVGAGAEQFDAFGLSLRDRRTRFEAALDVFRRLCAGEEVSMETPWKIERARIAAGPPEPGNVGVATWGPGAG